MPEVADVRYQVWGLKGGAPVPVYNSHLVGYPELRLGNRIREQRQHAGLTLKALARLTDISTARLSEIENGHHVLDLGQVITLAEALGLPAAFFLPQEAALPFQISRDADVRARPSHAAPALASDNGDGRAVEMWPLAGLFTGRHVEPALGQIGPAADDHPFWSHPYEEALLFGLTGRIEFLIDTPQGTAREELAAGDCLYFRSDIPHRLRSLTSQPAECLHVFCSRWGMPSTHLHLFATDSRTTAQADPIRQANDRLRLVREMHGWDLRHVAGLIEVPERQLARIERGERPIRIDLLLKLARVYGKPLRELIGEPISGGPYYTLQRAAETAAMPSRKRRTPVERPSVPASKTCQALAAGFEAPSMFPYLVRLLNVEPDTLTLHEHHGHEFIYVLDGQIELTTFVGTREVQDVLLPGDSIYLDSSVPHLLRGQTRSPFSRTMAEVIDVFWCPLGEAYLFDDAE